MTRAPSGKVSRKPLRGSRLKPFLRHCFTNSAYGQTVIFQKMSNIKNVKKSTKLIVNTGSSRVDVGVLLHYMVIRASE